MHAGTELHEPGALRRIDRGSWACTGTKGDGGRGSSIAGRGTDLGSYDTAVEAAKARDRKAYELLGEFAYLNFPEDYGR